MAARINTITVRLADAGTDRLKTLAEARGLTRSDVVRAALAFALSHPGFERAWRDYRPTDGRRAS